MNYKEALNKLKEIERSAFSNNLEEGRIRNEALKIAIKAVKKQIRTKPIIEELSPARCPSCGAGLSESRGDGYYKHYTGLTVCECGQLLKWED